MEKWKFNLKIAQGHGFYIGVALTMEIREARITIFDPATYK